MELQQRFSFAFVPLVFCILGVALTLLPRTSRASRSWAFVLCLFWLVIYYVLLSFGKALGDKGIVQPFVALWFPNVVIGAIATHLFFRAVKESPLRMQAWLDSTVIWTRKLLLGFRRRAPV